MILKKFKLHSVPSGNYQAAVLTVTVCYWLTVLLRSFPGKEGEYGKLQAGNPIALPRFRHFPWLNYFMDYCKSLINYQSSEKADCHFFQTVFSLLSWRKEFTEVGIPLILLSLFWHCLRRFLLYLFYCIYELKNHHGWSSQFHPSFCLVLTVFTPMVTANSHNTIL